MGIANQLDKFSQGTFSGLTERFDPERKYPELHAAGIAADESAATASEWLKREYLSRTTNIDAVGEERFSLWASHYTGAKLDLRATYEWGMADLAQINQRMWRVARKLLPEANSLREVADFLEADPKYKIFGTDTLLEKLKAFTAETTAKMDGIHFDIDESIKFYDVKLAPKEVLRHLITSPQVKTCRALVRLGSLRKVRPNLVGGGCHRCGTTKLFQVIIYKQPLRSLSRII